MPPRKHHDSDRAYRLLVLVSLAFTALVYRPILGMYFHDDDFFYLYRVVNVDFLQHVFTMHGGHLLVTRNALFSLLYWVFGPQAEYFFWTIFLTHLLNVYLLFDVVHAFTGSARLACFGGILWGTSPLHIDTLSWYSVYGQLLVASILLWLLRQIARGGPDWQPGVPRVATWILALLLASTSFALGIAVTIAFPLVAFLLLPPSSARRRIVGGLVALAVLMPFVYLGAHRVHAMLEPVAPPAAFRIGTSFADVQRTVGMLLQLIGFGTAQLLAGVVRLRIKYMETLPLVLNAVFLGGVIAAYVSAPRTMRRRMLACAVLCVACYGSIAAGRAVFSTAVPYVAKADRYHYVATVTLTVLLCLVVAQLGAVPVLRTSYKNALFGLWLTLSIVIYSREHYYLNTRTKERNEVQYTLSTIRERIADQPPGSAVYIPNRHVVAFGRVYRQMPAVLPGWAALFAIFFPENVVEGRRVYFVDANPAVVAAAQHGKRSAGLITSEDPDAAARSVAGSAAKPLPRGRPGSPQSTPRDQQ